MPGDGGIETASDIRECASSRLLLRRPAIVLTDDSQRPDWIDAEAEIKPGLLDGIHDVASPTGVVPEWTRLVPGEVPAGSGTGKAA